MVETHAQSVRKSTLVAIDRALEWPFGTSQRILEGDEAFLICEEPPE